MMKSITKTCEKCGQPFGARSEAALYCVDCKPIIARERSAASRKKAALKPVREVKSMKEFLREIDKYNRENRTHLTYGQYEMLKHRGLID